MTTYLRCLFAYFENVLHPASGWSNEPEKRKRRTAKAQHMLPSPDCFNVRGAAKKNDKMRRSPAP
jgi:hypothetical protein